MIKFFNWSKMYVDFSIILAMSMALTVESDKLGIGSTLYCYQCVSTHPGCGEPFNWLWYWSQACPEVDDTCVKVIERQGASEVIIRDCLSSLRAIRTDIPSDHYEGCRPAATDFNLAHYVNNSIKELDIKRNFYSDVTWCFCYFDNRCNVASHLHISLFLIFVVLLLRIF